eukprot:m.16134 g.16134  ORF g.16134 m.16134 type:complete len:126 (+) comp3104_c0_seq2:259-636(+)
MEVELQKLSVKEIKALLSERQIPCTGCFEKSELIALLLGKIESTGSGGDNFLTSIMGAAPGLAAAYQLKLEGMSVAELKAHLQERGIDTTGALERQELIGLALNSNRDRRTVDTAPELSEHLLEC